MDITAVHEPSAGQAGPTMTGILQERYGAAPEAVLHLGTSARPAVSIDEVLVRVHAASVDRGTWHIMAGLPYPIRLAGFGLRRPKHANPGRSLAGTVEAIGSAVIGFAVGDEVFGTANATLAEFAVAAPGRLTAKPANLTFAEAAAVPISGLTALQAVRKGQVQAGQQVLITGASGGVGSFAVQAAKAHGAVVTAVCSTAKVDRVRALGADHVIDHTREQIGDRGQHYDVIIDIAGNRSLSSLRRVLTRRGRLVITGGETDGRMLGGSDRQIRATLLSPFVRQKLGTFISSENATDLIELRRLIESGSIAPVIDSSYPLAQTVAAMQRLTSGQAMGKVVVTVA